MSFSFLFAAPIIAILLECSACTGLSERDRRFRETRLERNQVAKAAYKSWPLQSVSEAVASNSAGKALRVVGPSESLAALLLALNRTAAFKPAGRASYSPSGSPILSSLSMAALGILKHVSAGTRAQGISSEFWAGDAQLCPGYRHKFSCIKHKNLAQQRLFEAVLAECTDDATRTFIVSRSRVPISQMSSAVDEGAVMKPLVVFGPGSVDLRLLIAKLAAKAGHPAAIFAGPQQKGLDERWRKLMYGRNASKGNVQVTDAKVLSSLEELGEALDTAEVLCIVADSEPLVESTFTSLLRQSPNVKELVLVSQMGVTRAKPGFMGMGDKEVQMLAAEEAIRREAAERGVQLSVVRVGTLKGGGPGGEGKDTNADDAALGLTKVYYDGILELDTFMTSQAHDKFTLGAKVTAGDPFDLPNAFMRAAKKGSFDASDDETNRIVAAAAVVKVLSLAKSVDISVSSAKSQTLPTEQEWDVMLSNL